MKNKGIELGVDGVITNNATAFVNYAFQAEPVPSFPGLTETQALAEINLPSKHLFTIGMTGNYKRAVRHDFREPRVRGVLAGRARRAVLGLHRAVHVGEPDHRHEVERRPIRRGAEGRRTSANQTIQQHIFGDIIKRHGGEFKVESAQGGACTDTKRGGRQAAVIFAK